MRLVVLHIASNPKNDAIANACQDSRSLLRLAFCNKPLKDVVIETLTGWYAVKPDDFIVAVPREWKHNGADDRCILYEDKIPVPPALFSAGRKSWRIIANGRFVARANPRLISEAVQHLGCDVVAVNIDPNIRAGTEHVHIDSQRNLFGFRLLYADTVRPMPVPADWPHLLFINPCIVDRLFPGKVIPCDFDEFIDECNSNSITTGYLNAGGTLLDLHTADGLLAMLSDYSLKKRSGIDVSADKARAASGARIFGNVLFGRDVKVGENVVIAAPCILCDSAEVAGDTIIQSSIIGPDVSIPANSVVRNRVITDSSQIRERDDFSLSFVPFGELNRSPFRTWPPFAYVRCAKRLADIIVAAFVLAIFIPFVPIIAVAIKLSSKGPVFFRSIRQGLHGKPFACYKFRTMQVGSHRLQDELREFNEADGPQFVIADDPRMSRVGKFLRETYIDEIPQFFAVLLGHMSVVGPRPSPESENVLCPFWRDARLSVKPGVTGLWQACRTRKPMRDFQEWIHYDIEYVRNLSPAFDLWICWKTFLKMVRNFVRQFQ